MTEAARQLLEQVRRDFLAEAEADPALRALREKIDAGEGGYAGAEDYAYKLGELLSGKLREALGLQSDALFREAAAEVLRGALAEDHSLVSTAAASVQEALNRQAGLGLKAETAPLDQDRVEGLAQRVQEAESFDKAEWLLKEPVKNFSQSVVDETLKRNVEAQGKAGLRPRIVRKASGGCCQWCAALAGKYDYPDVPREVYQRHERCRCTVEYDPGYGRRRQDVWTKSWTSPEEDAIIEERKTYGLERTNRPVPVAEREKNADLEARGFRTTADPMREAMGSAEDSHPEEIKKLEKHLADIGVALHRPEHERLMYEPGIFPGEPGIAIISKGASYSAWLHEVKHADDDYADNWPGMRFLADTEKYIKRETDAYQIEINLAHEIGRADIAKRLEALRDAEIERIRRISG